MTINSIIYDIGALEKDVNETASLKRRRLLGQVLSPGATTYRIDALTQPAAPRELSQGAAGTLGSAQCTWFDTCSGRDAPK
jgi:hypothetical protein